MMNVFSFTAHFDSEISRREHFKLERDKIGVSCRRCQHDQHYWIKSQWSYECKKCSALDHLKYLYDLNILSHYQDDATSPYFTGKTPSKRCKQPAGENAALDAVYSGDPFNQDLRVVAQVLPKILKKSPGHRANMLHRKYKTFGFAGSLENVKSISNFYFVTSIGVQTFGY